MMHTIRRFIAQRRKAIVGVAVGAIAAQAVRYGIDLTDAQTDWLTLLLTSASVYMFPNAD
jgi:hypothetical protein